MSACSDDGRDALEHVDPEAREAQQNVKRTVRGALEHLQHEARRLQRTLDTKFSRFKQNHFRSILLCF